MKEDRRISRKEKVVIGIIIGLAIAAWLAALLLGPTQAIMPPYQGAPVPSSKPYTPPRTPVHRLPAPSPVPLTNETKIYVVARDIPAYWGINKVITGWNLAVWTDFVPVDSCPSFQPCITVTVDPKLRKDYAAETAFGYSNDIAIRLNPIVTNRREAQSTVCHEFGHALGLPHIKGTGDTCMTETDDYYRVLPSKLDLRLANSFGAWNLAKMYGLSGKDIDVRTAPK